MNGLKNDTVQTMDTGIHSFKTEEFEIIELLSKDYEIQQLCSLMGVSRSGYYKWKNAISRNGI